MTEGYVVAGGPRLFYLEEGKGPLVLFLHGFPETSFSWRHQLGPVGEAGFRAVAIDLPGYGRSDKPDVTYDIHWVTDRIADVITGLGYERAVVVGHDWGGLIAWPFARLHAGRVAGVVGLNTPDLPRTPVPPTRYIADRGNDKHNYVLFFQERGKPEELFEADPEGVLRSFYQGWSAKHPEAFSDDVVKVYVDAFAPKGAATPPLEYYRNMDRNWELLAPVADAKIEVPCLMITAEDDPVLHPGLAVGMEERVPDLETVLVRDCGHWTQQEQPAEVTAHLVRYLTNLREARGPW